MKSLLFTLFLLLSTVLIIRAQQVITGKVVSDNHQPLNATIKLKAGHQITIANEDGNFTIKTSQNKDTLIVSFIGYKTQLFPLELPVSNPLLIILATASTELNAITISTGYQTLPKERATGSFDVLNQNALNASVSPDIVSRLKNIASGISFDERNQDQPQFSVRGLSTIYGNAQPLIVLNNFPYEGDINNINPNDVESITVLKDAAAASIWGVRAANGVIVINTKKGSPNKPTEVSFNSAVTISNKPDVFKLPLMSSNDFIGVEKYLFANGFYDNAAVDPTNPPLTPAVEAMLAQRNGTITTDQLNQQLAALGKLDVRNDFNKYLYQNSLNQQYALNLSGGTEKSTYYYSAGYDHNTNNLDGRYTRISLRADNTYSFGEKFKLNPVISFTRTVNTAGRPDYTRISPGFNYGYALYPYAQLADATGNPLPIVKDYRFSYAQQAQANGLEDWTYSPLSDFKDRHTTTQSNDILLGLNADYKLSQKLTAQVQYQFETASSDLSDLYDADSYYARDLVNRFTQVDASGNLTFPVPPGGILNTGNTLLMAQTGRGQLKYNNTWAKSDLTVLAGAEIRQTGQQGNNYTTYGYNPNGLTSTPVDYITQFPQYNNAGNLQGIPYNTGFAGTLNRYTSYYANASYTYDQRYILSGSARKDASNLFGVNSNLRGVPLWSAGFAWNISNEKFYSANWLTYLKLRLTYGYNGNLPQNQTALASIIETTDNLNNQPYGIVNTYPNPNLRWEKVGVLNAGIDFGSRNNVLTGSVEFYSKKSTDLIARQPIDPTVGIPSGLVFRNVADMLTRGVDIQLNTKNLTRQFKWQTGILFNYNRDEVTAYNTNGASGGNYVFGGYGISPLQGKPIYSISSFKWAGLDPANGNPVGIVNGQRSEDYSAIVYKTPISGLDYNGPALPPFFGAVSNTFDYKGFTLYINISYRLGYYFKKSTINYYNLYNNWAGNSDFAQRWQKPGDEAHTHVPSMPALADDSYERDFFYQYSSANVQKADNIRLQDLNISYRIPLPKNNTLHLKDLQVYIYGRNLGILWRANKRGIDPDYPDTALPPSYSISFGLKTRF